MIGADIRLFSSDLDGTLLGDARAIHRFARLWSELPVGTRPLLAYNTGRSVDDTQQLVATRGLPAPDYIIGSLGTELYDSLYRHDTAFYGQFGRGWDVDVIDAVVAGFPSVKRQPGKFRHRFKSSWYWPRARGDEIDEVRSRLTQAGIRATVVYSCRYFLDVVPYCAGKGRALAWLCHRLDIAMPRVLVAGDTGNDAEMFLLPGINGVVVQNALPELLAVICRSDPFVARYPMTEGVVEGLRAYQVLP